MLDFTSIFCFYWSLLHRLKLDLNLLISFSNKLTVLLLQFYYFYRFSGKRDTYIFYENITLNLQINTLSIHTWLYIIKYKYIYPTDFLTILCYIYTISKNGYYPQIWGDEKSLSCECHEKPGEFQQRQHRMNADRQPSSLKMGEGGTREERKQNERGIANMSSFFFCWNLW